MNEYYLTFQEIVLWHPYTMKHGAILVITKKGPPGNQWTEGFEIWERGDSLNGAYDQGSKGTWVLDDPPGSRVIPAIFERKWRA